MSDNTLHIKRQWETELNTVLEDEVWTSICARCHSGIQSQLWKEFDWKVKMRFFRTPLTACPYKENSTNKCWRNCDMVGDHTHIFWGCPKIKAYWNNIKKELDKIFRTDIPLDPLSTLLDHTQEQMYNKDQCYIMHILLTVARKMITINWMQPGPPTIDMWVKKVRQIYKMEHMTAQLQLKLGRFEEKWTLVSNYLNTDHGDREVSGPQT